VVSVKSHKIVKEEKKNWASTLFQKLKKNKI